MWADLDQGTRVLSSNLITLEPLETDVGLCMTCMVCAGFLRVFYVEKASALTDDVDDAEHEAALRHNGDEAEVLVAFRSLAAVDHVVHLPH